MVVLTAETCWALNDYWINNKISGIKLVFSLLKSLAYCLIFAGSVQELKYVPRPDKKSQRHLFPSGHNTEEKSLGLTVKYPNTKSLLLAQRWQFYKWQTIQCKLISEEWFTLNTNLEVRIVRREDERPLLFLNVTRCMFVHYGTNRLSRNVSNKYQHMVHNIQGQQRSPVPSGKILKSCKTWWQW